MIFEKCDRCGVVCEGLITVQTSIPKEPTGSRDKPPKEQHSFFGFMSMHVQDTQSIDLCFDCTKILIRWMNHPENFLTLAKK